MEARPGPTPDEDSAPFWQGLREHQILLQKCLTCAEVRFPPMPGCLNCGSTKVEQIVAKGEGRIYSWIVIHRPLGTFTDADLPATIATVELAEGCRMLGRLYAVGEPQVDLPVKAAFVDHDSWTELVFVPEGEV
jgi:uncharacterized OB-fold protein